jgi:pre-mRNA-processing factor 6
MQAANLEGDLAAKKRVMLRALERVPHSVKLWKAVVEISDEDDARILLVSHYHFWLRFDAW